MAIQAGRVFSLALLAVTAGCSPGGSPVASLAEPASAEFASGVDSLQFDVAINQPGELPRVSLGIVDEAGNAITAACSTCHATRPPDPKIRKASDLRNFHQGLIFAHGQITCTSCHNTHDYDSLKLADGTAVSFTDVMQLCAQCHGPQTRDYEHGAHGGMTGYWDLSRGPRQRNNCVDCHDPHAPAFPKMQPTFKPRDRFLEPSHD